MVFNVKWEWKIFAERRRNKKEGRRQEGQTWLHGSESITRKGRRTRRKENKQQFPGERNKQEGQDVVCGISLLPL